jgi:hypothetical protein
LEVAKSGGELLGNVQKLMLEIALSPQCALRTARRRRPMRCAFTRARLAGVLPGTKGNRIGAS